MQNMTSTITPYVPGTRQVFMSPRFSHLEVDVNRETGDAYLYNGCAIVDTRSDVADMSISDAQKWCVEYERSLWEAAHEEALAEDGERAGFFEVPEVITVDGIEYDVEPNTATTHSNPNEWHVVITRTSERRSAVKPMAMIGFPKGEDWRAARYYNVRDDQGGIMHPRSLADAVRAELTRKPLR